MVPQVLHPDEVARTPGLDDWTLEVDHLVASFVARSFGAAGGLVAAIATAADLADHHPDVELRFPGRVGITLTTHDAGGVTTRDVELARTISRLAADAGASDDGRRP